MGAQVLRTSTLDWHPTASPVSAPPPSLPHRTPRCGQSSGSRRCADAARISPFSSALRTRRQVPPPSAHTRAHVSIAPRRPTQRTGLCTPRPTQSPRAELRDSLPRPRGPRGARAHACRPSPALPRPFPTPGPRAASGNFSSGRCGVEIPSPCSPALPATPPAPLLSSGLPPETRREGHRGRPGAGGGTSCLRERGEGWGGARGGRARRGGRDVRGERLRRRRSRVRGGGRARGWARGAVRSAPARGARAPLPLGLPRLPLVREEGLRARSGGSASAGPAATCEPPATAGGGISAGDSRRRSAHPARPPGASTGAHTPASARTRTARPQRRPRRCSPAGRGSFPPALATGPSARRCSAPARRGQHDPAERVGRGGGPRGGGRRPRERGRRPAAAALAHAAALPRDAPGPPAALPLARGRAAALRRLRRRAARVLLRPQPRALPLRAALLPHRPPARHGRALRLLLQPGARVLGHRRVLHRLLLQPQLPRPQGGARARRVGRAERAGQRRALLRRDPRLLPRRLQVRRAAPGQLPPAAVAGAGQPGLLGAEPGLQRAVHLGGAGVHRHHVPQQPAGLPDPRRPGQPRRGPQVRGRGALRHRLVHPGAGGPVRGGARVPQVFQECPEPHRPRVHPALLHHPGGEPGGGEHTHPGQLGQGGPGPEADAHFPHLEAGQALHRPPLPGGHPEVQLQGGGAALALPLRGDFHLLRRGLHHRKGGQPRPGHHPRLLVVGHRQHDHRGVWGCGPGDHGGEADRLGLHPGRYPSGGAAHHLDLQQVLPLLSAPEAA